MHRRVLLILSLLLSSALFAGCALTRSRPCSKAGDTTWYPPIVGNMQCYQTKTPGGELQNQGQFRQYYPSGKLALEGTFVAGKKDGLWIQYNESGDRVAERWFENGIERSIPDSRRSTVDEKARGP
ncbi:MAG: hypothetical protein JST04_11530 [Bdellovibrionales bacterium]|nr:hypothetical protein [Bdellovibrionales bacterium]